MYWSALVLAFVAVCSFGAESPPSTESAGNVSQIRPEVSTGSELALWGVAEFRPSVRLRRGCPAIFSYCSAVLTCVSLRRPSEFLVS